MFTQLLVYQAAPFAGGILKLVELKSDGNTAEDSVTGIVAAIVENRCVRHDLLCAADIGRVHKTCGTIPDLMRDSGVIVVDESGMVKIERYPPALYIRFGRCFGIRWNQPAMGIKAPDVPVFRMGDDPALIIEHEGIIAAFVGREKGGEVATRVDMLGKLHQMSMVKRDDNRAVE